MALNTQIGRYYLGVILGDTPRLHLYEREAPVEILNGERHYRDAGYGDAVGLYDWLRAENGQLIGVALTLLEETDALAQAWSHLPYVSIEDVDSYVKILFVSYKGTIYNSGDQNISTSKVLVSEDLEYALILDAIGLTDRDIKLAGATTTDGSEVALVWSKS